MVVDANKQRSVDPRRLALAVAGAIVLAGVAGWSLLHQVSAAPPVPAGVTVAPPAPPTVLVFVSGAVAHPGLYELSPAARIADAIAAAGGVTTLADPGHLPNMAQRVNDGRQINVPFLKSGTTAAKLDINTAAQADLDAVPGMPPGLAAEIVQYRDEWGPFTSMSQLHSDLGVDSATVTGLEHYLRVVLPQQ
ncbi:MAG TPA: helix-hairpin-helix domain-containing protein [Candidatus Saccharimonadales bacterium]|nr:helix-hairpin-helix domain-containing protein [Candidatus Saccharimonadales bacterium]